MEAINLHVIGGVSLTVHLLYQITHSNANCLRTLGGVDPRRNW